MAVAHGNINAGDTLVLVQDQTVLLVVADEDKYIGGGHDAYFQVRIAKSANFTNTGISRITINLNHWTVYTVPDDVAVRHIMDILTTHNES